MNSLENRLDKEVEDYLERVEGTPEISALLKGEIDRDDYVRLLKTCYMIEHVSRRAVLLASRNTKDTNPYLSQRFDYCAKGEEGHAQIALNDLKGMGVEGVAISDIPSAEEYDSHLQEAAENFPLGILGHSYLFENASGIMFPKHPGHDYPSVFIDVHAKEDPGHSQAIKRTVRNVETELSEEEVDKVVTFARESGERLLKIFQGV